MTRFIVQIRLVRLPDADAEPDRWSSGFSSMTDAEVSVPFDSDDNPPRLATSQPFLDAVTKALARFGSISQWEVHRDE